ncbi:MAG: hypothetical protein NVSMB2_21270 [Chloroflexota bacterium]
MLAVRAVTKTSPDVIANGAVTLGVHAGQVHAILDENGAGTSTLMKILYGFYAPDAGSIRLDGTEVALRSPSLGVQLVLLVLALTLASGSLVGALVTVRRRAALHDQIMSHLVADVRRCLEDGGLVGLPRALPDRHVEDRPFVRGTIWPRAASRERRLWSVPSWRSRVVSD